MKVGIGIPCRKSDIPVVERYALASISRLDPAPYKVYIYVNEAGYDGLGRVRAHIFDTLFERGCDVVLQCSTDYILFRDILAHVSIDQSTGFGYIFSTPFATLIAVTRRLLARNPWTGCYALIKSDWDTIKASEIWDGHDWSVQKNITSLNVVKWPKFMARRRRVKRVVSGALFHPENLGKSLISKMGKVARGFPL